MPGILKRILIPVILAAGLIAALVYSQERGSELVVSGFVEADEIRVGSRVGGRIAAVHIEEGQQVSAGDVLLELDPFDLQERLAAAEHSLARAAANHRQLVDGFRTEEIAQARARRDQAKAVLEKMRNGPRPQEIAAAKAAVDLAQAELLLANQVYQRTESLFGRQAADQSDLDDAASKLKVATAKAQSNQEQLDLLQAGTRSEDIAAAEAQLEEAEQEVRLRESGSRPEDIRAAEAARDAAAAEADAIRQQLQELHVIAPLNATVDAFDLRSGDLLSPNAPAVALVDTSRLWIRAYVPENRLNLQIGEQVQVRIDSFPGRTFTGEVSFIARQAEFTPGNVQTPEERSKQVFRIKVTLVDGQDVLRPGMSADVVLSSGDS
ncbi:MAG: efflux RND transporter periplasmic adaptor subunit [Planctomycetaceae bacterium]